MSGAVMIATISQINPSLQIPNTIHQNICSPTTFLRFI
ncbi:hypothetical protein BM51_1388 [Streptococcus pneumoniae]|nr:hypothetical protein BM51_1388 [Streptococcus pneumoniae]